MGVFKFVSVQDRALKLYSPVPYVMHTTKRKNLKNIWTKSIKNAYQTVT